MMEASLNDVLSTTPEGVQLRLKVVPGASRTRIAGVLGRRLKVTIAAPPQQGQANIALCQLIAETLGISLRQVRITTGAGSGHKTLELTGIDPDTVLSRLRGCVKV